MTMRGYGRVRWFWVAVAIAFAALGWVVFLMTSGQSCASGDPACTGDGAVDLVQAVVIVVVTVGGSGWALRRAFGGEPGDHTQRGTAEER